MSARFLYKAQKTTQPNPSITNLPRVATFIGKHHRCVMKKFATIGATSTVLRCFSFSGRKRERWNVWKERRETHFPKHQEQIFKSFKHSTCLELNDFVRLRSVNILQCALVSNQGICFMDRIVLLFHHVASEVCPLKITSRLATVDASELQLTSEGSFCDCEKILLFGRGFYINVFKGGEWWVPNVWNQWYNI